MTLPLQPIEKDKNGVSRFKGNAIVSYLLERGGIDMNKLATLDFPREDREQFAQFIGYSLSGFGELSYVSDEAYAAACKMAETGMAETEARNEHLRTEMDALRAALREPLARLYGIHPDDLGG